MSSDSPHKATTEGPGVAAREAPAGALANLGSSAAGSKPAHEADAAPGHATPDARRSALGRLIRCGSDAARNADTPGASPQGILEAALEVALAYGFIEPKRANAIAAACADMGAELGIPAEVRTWRRIRDELRTLRQALHIEGEQTATEAARGLEDVAARVCDRFGVGEPDPGDSGYVACDACNEHVDWDRSTEELRDAVARVEHRGDCFLALAWHALGKPGPVGYP